MRGFFRWQQSLQRLPHPVGYFPDRRQRALRTLLTLTGSMPLQFMREPTAGEALPPPGNGLSVHANLRSIIVQYYYATAVGVTHFEF